MRTLMLLVLASCLVIAGCGNDPTVNARGDDEQRQASIERVKDSLPEDKHAEFEDAMRTLLFADFRGLADLADGEGVARRFEDRVHGLSGEQIIAEAERVRVLKAEQERQREIQRAQEERQRKLDQINELAAKLEAESAGEVARFVVNRARFTTSDESRFGRDSTIELSVVNETESAVSRAYFHAMLLTPGREIPWVDAEFIYEIPGGLEPGERASWRLSPNMFGEWSKAPDDRFDTLFVVRAIQIDGADGQPIGAERLTEFEEDRLLRLLDEVEGDRADEVRTLLDDRQDAVIAWRESVVPNAAIQERNELRASREELNQIRVLDTRTSERSREFMSEPTIEVLIENNTQSLIEWVRGQIRITSPDRQVPWEEGRFIGLVRHGMEPGSQAWVSLSKSSDYGMGRWSLPPEGTDSTLQVRIESAEAPESAPAFAIGFAEPDEKRLEALTAMIAAQNWER